MKNLVLIASLLLASASFAQTSKMTKPASAKMAKTDVTGTVTWTGYGVGKSHVGHLTIKSGQVEMKSDEIVGGNFVIDMTSLAAPDSAKLQGHLQSPDFFDVQKFPEAKFKMTKIERLKETNEGKPNYKITGDLTIKDKTNSEEFMAIVTKQGKDFVAKAETEIKDRTKYGIVYNSAQFKAASALGDKLIEDKIKIQLDLKTK